MASKPTDIDTRAKSRMLSVELLRVCAMLGIVVFHTFQPWFESLVAGSETITYDTLGLLHHPVDLALLGFIDQLGAWGNHVFIMISGCFLLPRARRGLEAGQGMVRLMRRSLQRARGIAFTVVLYAALALFASLWFPDVTGVALDNLAWFAQGLQFVWIYLVLVLLCPVIAHIWGRVRHQGALLVALVLLVYGINAYIAFVSPGSLYRDLFEWRKLMSAVTYGLSFVVGGWLGERYERGALTARTAARTLLLVGLAITVAVEASAAARGDLVLLEALSFKSTSFLAFLMAVGALVFALAAPRELGEGRADLNRAVAFVTSGMLGLYVLQALFSRGWHMVSNDLLDQALRLGTPVFFLAGVTFGIVLFLLLVVVDAVVRQPLATRLWPKR